MLTYELYDFFGYVIGNANMYLLCVMKIGIFFNLYIWDSNIVIHMVEFQELSYLTRDLSLAEKKINVGTSWANAQIVTTLFHSKFSKVSF